MPDHSLVPGSTGQSHRHRL